MGNKGSVSELLMSYRSGTRYGRSNFGSKPFGTDNEQEYDKRRGSIWLQ